MHETRQLTSSQEGSSERKLSSVGDLVLHSRGVRRLASPLWYTNHNSVDCAFCLDLAERGDAVDSFVGAKQAPLEQSRCCRAIVCEPQCMND